MKRSTILVVDDNEAVRDLLRDRLKRQGYGVVTAVNGRDALDKMQQQSFDLMLLDIMMPEMNGYEVLAYLKDIPKPNHIPIVVLSALHDMASVVKCIELGAEDYLFKPINSSLLWARITASLEKKQLRDQAQARLDELAILQQVDRQLNASLDVTEVARITLRYALQQTQADGGLFLTLADDYWQVQAALGVDKPVAEKLPFSALGVEDATCNGRIHQYPLEEGNGIVIAAAQSGALVPICREEVVYGLLIIESRDSCDNDSCTFLSRLSDHAAIALNNAQLYADVLAATRAKSDFVAMVSHELKTPLSAITVYGDLLQKGAGGPLTEKQLQYLDAVNDSVSRMTNLVTELDDITHIETGQLHLEPTTIGLKEIVGAIFPLLTQEFEKRGQTVTSEIPEDLPPIWADRQRLSQVMINLLSNASKYTPEGGQIKLSARLHNPDEETAVCIIVADNGFGISQEEQPKIFSQFFRSDDSKVRDISGTGLGLNITKKIVELHGGKIWFESEYGQGTTFYFTIPAASKMETVSN